MKLKQILLTPGLSFTFTLSAQLGSVFTQRTDKFTAIDTALYVVSYKFAVVMDTANPDKKAEDELRLQIGRRVSKTYSIRAYKSDSVATAMIKKGAQAVPNASGTPLPEEFYKNYPTGKLTHTVRTSIVGILKYEESHPLSILWKLQPDKKTLLGYPCQKAETTFRGHTYTAWFTPEIPLKEGPAKFAELPGLILETYDTQRYFTYTCIGIEKPKKVTPIKFPDWQYTQLSRDKYKESMKRIHKQPLEIMKAKGHYLAIVRPDGTTDESPKNFSIAYNPVELE